MSQDVSLAKVSRYLDARLGIKVYKDPFQQKYIESMIKPTKEVQAIFLDAAAGTGKTSLAISVAYYLLEEGVIDQIIYVRNAVSIRELGFLPGDVAEKEMPYMQPGLDALSKLEPKNPKLIETLIEENQLVIATTAFLRGVDWDDKKFLIVDEAQNLNLQEMQMVLTRPHDTSKVVVIGSKLQCDEGTRAARYGKEKMLPFELFAYHYKHATDLKVEQLTLKNNYRGQFSLMADRIGHTISYLNQEAPARGELTKVHTGASDKELAEAWTEMGVKVYEN